MTLIVNLFSMKSKKNLGLQFSLLFQYINLKKNQIGCHYWIV